MLPRLALKLSDTRDLPLSQSSKQPRQTANKGQCVWLELLRLTHLSCQELPANLANFYLCGFVYTLLSTPRSKVWVFHEAK